MEKAKKIGLMVLVAVVVVVAFQWFGPVVKQRHTDSAAA